MMTTDNRQQAYRPSLAIYHPNAKGTGAAVRFELHPAHDESEGSIMLTIALQKTVGSRGTAATVFPTFDWENKMVVKLGFPDLCQMLQVLRGETESVGDGKGLYHRTSHFSTSIKFSHMLEPFPGYSLEVHRAAGKTEGHAFIVFSPWEALGLAESFSGAMAVVCFGIPMVRTTPPSTEPVAKQKVA